MVAVQSDTLLHALRVQLKRKVSARRGGDYNPSIFLVMLYKKRAGVLKFSYPSMNELELELIQTQMAQKPMLRAEVGMRVRCANKASAE